jgi:hypothetical protein
MPQNPFFVATKSPGVDVYVFDTSKHPSDPGNKNFAPQIWCVCCAGGRAGGRAGGQAVGETAAVPMCAFAGSGAVAIGCSGWMDACPHDPRNMSVLADTCGVCRGAVAQVEGA